MKRMIGPLGIGMVMGASVASMYFLMPKAKSKKKMLSPYMSSLTSDKDK